MKNWPGGEKKKIVVLGGSFNPPTSAHYELMKVAVDALGADIGFFVPVSDAYLRRKMSRSHPPVVLSSELRVKMLQTMCVDDCRFQVCEKEIGTIEPRTIPTLESIQEDYPNAEVYFIMGADKLDLLVHLTEKRKFLDDFKVALYSREDDRVEQVLKEHELLSHYLNRIVILPQPEGTEGVSSSLVRDRMFAGESSEDLLCHEVWELFKSYSSADFPDVINRFKDEYAFLNNRFPCRVVWQGKTYSNAELAFQASNCNDENRLEVMESILRVKFELNSNLMRKLVDTGNLVLVNGNNKQETFWGIDLYSWEGENHLGKIIMDIRKKEKSK